MKETNESGRFFLRWKKRTIFCALIDYSSTMLSTFSTPPA